jgi:hypothetical protein
MWSETQQISGVTQSDVFGHSVSMYESNLAISRNVFGTVDMYKSYDDGVYWDPVTVLNENNKNLDVHSGDYELFAKYVSLYGNLLAVGQKDSSYSTGSVSMYESFDGGQTWLEEFVVTAVESEDYDSFGDAVSLFGSTVVIGAQNATTFDAANGSTSRTGSVFTFEKSFFYEKIKNSVLPKKELTSVSPASGDRFGSSVSISFDLMAIGATKAADRESIVTGTVTILRTFDGGVTWELSHSEIEPADNNYMGDFGHSVSLYGYTLVAGAPSSLGGGSVYVLRSSDGGYTWSNAQTILPSISPYNFGYSVSLYGNVFIAGAPDQGGGDGNGFVFVYQTFDGGLSWSETSIVAAADGASKDRFGISVSLYQSTFVVGRYQNEFGLDTGSVYVYSSFDGGATWSQVQKVMASNGIPNDGFGFSVSLSRHRFAVGAYQRIDPTSGAGGAVYVYSSLGGASTWSETTMLIAHDGIPDDFLGLSVCIDDNTIVAGTPGYDILPGFGEAFDAGVADIGAIYVFATHVGGNLWSEQFTVVGSENGTAAENSNLGTSVSVHGNLFAGGTYDVTSEFLPNGQVYPYILHAVGQTEYASFSTKIYEPGNITENNAFGNSVLCYGEFILVGSNYGGVGKCRSFVLILLFFKFNGCQQYLML